MPESPTPSPSSAPGLDRGLAIDRVFAPADADPFDTCEWETRTASITNPSGDTIFEQSDVEFPAHFSQLATNIVASKYFYGDRDAGNGSPADGKREFSLRQLIDRVTRTISDWGRTQGYFASTEDADAFYDELTWLCLHQHGSFNSPVWFNVGLGQQYGIRDSGDTAIFGYDREADAVATVDPYERPQASACFIVDVEDSIDGIWETMAESARLFKFGSGVGADWSTLRSTKEKLSGGGIPSGPVSFMKVQDATGGTIKSGGKTRRAAIMQTLKCWHPDVEAFVVAKMEEEKKAHALIEQGYDGSFNGPAYGSVAFQNVNQSLRVTDAFMEAAEKGESYPLRAVRTGETAGHVDAAKLLEKVSEGTHLCGDPGLQFEDTIQAWHTCKNTGPINSSNPCSEYVFLDNSACNLASLNLRKFQNADGSIDVERLRAAARIFITAQEILVDNAGYPGEEIARNSHRFRPLGLGFANLGALLMAMGLPYDSDAGRAVAGAVQAIIHCEAYARSAEIAANTAIGPFEGYADNEAPFLAVMRKHRAAVEDIDAAKVPDSLLDAARESAARMVALGEEHGYRNAQSTVIAPTGTIGFYLDCDTTGIEPDIALVKYKLLAGEGDGMMKIVNRSVADALDRLGYTERQIEDIIGYIDANDTIEGAPELKAEHLPVFDCAFKPRNGSRAIHPMGHIRMMAAVQPFVSGAISKTVNMPETATVADIADAYRHAWELGLKAVAIYRENSKKSQPLSTSEDGNTQKSDARNAAAPSAGDGAVSDRPEGSEKVVYKPTRKRLPDERPSLTHKFSIAGHEGYLTVGLYPESVENGDPGRPGEIFITMAKQGSTLAGMMDAFATSVSIALQYGVPLEDLCRKFSHMRFEPSGFTNNKQIPIAKSIMDYIFRYLSIKFLSRDPDRESDPEAAPAGGTSGNPKPAAADLDVSRSGPSPDVSGTDVAGEEGSPAADVRQGELDFGEMGSPASGARDDLIGRTVESFMETTGGSTADRSSSGRPSRSDPTAFQNQSDAPPCPECGSITIRSGACYQCPNCGASTGCG